MSKDIIDAVVASTPLNVTAAKVMARGEHYKPSTPMPPGYMHWDAQPKTKTYSGDPTGTSINLTGHKFGRFTVIGVLDEKGGRGRGMRWVVRCTCGHFEARSTKAIRAVMAGIAVQDLSAPLYSCWECSAWTVAKNRYNKQGARPLSDFTATPKNAEFKVSSPDEVISLHLTAPDPLAAAHKLIADLNRAGYRIVRA